MLNMTFEKRAARMEVEKKQRWLTAKCVSLEIERACSRLVIRWERTCSAELREVERSYKPRDGLVSYS